MDILPKDVQLDVDFVCVDKEYFYYLLSCLIAQKNMGKMQYEQREIAQQAVDKAFEDGVNILKGIDFVPKSDVLFRRTMIKLSEEYMKGVFDIGE